MKTTLKFSIVLLLLAVAAMQVQAQNLLLPKYEFTVNGFGGLSTLNYKITDFPDYPGAKMKMGLGGGLGFGFNYFFSDNIGLVTGLEAALYRASFSAPITRSMGILFDPIDIHDFKESQNYLALQLPIMVQFLAPMDPLGIRHFYAGIGGKVGYGLWGNYKQSGVAWREMPFDTKESLKFAPFNAMGSVEAGVRWKLGGNMALYTGIYADYGFLNIIPDVAEAPDDALCGPDKNGLYHNSILAANYPDYGSPTHGSRVATARYTDKVSSLAAGIKIKLAFGTPKKKIVPVYVPEPEPAPVVVPEPEPAPVIKEVPQEIKRSMMILSNTLFAFDKWNLTEEAVTELNKVVKWLNDNPDIKVQIDGHTDNYGTAQYNQRLSEDRAKSVYNYFVEHGVNASRLSWRGYSLHVPIADNSTAEGRQLNRRVELQIIQ